MNELHSINSNKKIKNNILPNNGLLPNGFLIPKLLNNPFDSCSFKNLYFFLLHRAHFDNSTVLPIFVFNTFGSTFSAFSVSFCTLNNMATCFIMTCV